MSANTVEIRLAARDEASSVINGVVGNLRGLMAQMAAMAGIAAGGAALAALVKRGVEFNSTMENTKGGIAGVLMMTRDYTDASGKAASGQAKLTAAFKEASQIQEKLKVDALQTAASYTELANAFNSALGPAAAAGVTDLDEVRKITVMATQAMAALSIPTVQAAQEIRGLFSGETGPDNRLNQVMRITKAELAAVAGNAEATAKLFTDRLGPAAAAAAMQTGTLTVRLSNLGDIIDSTLGKATAGIFKSISDGVAGMISGVGASGASFQKMGDSLSKAFATVLAWLQDMGPAALAFVVSLTDQLPAIADLLAKLPLKEIFQILTDLIKVTDGWAIAVAGVVYAFGGLKGISGMLGALPGVIAAVTGALEGVTAGIVGVTGASVAAGSALALAFGAGVFAAAIWGIAKIIEGLRVAAELKGELDKEKASKADAGEALVGTLGRWKARLIEIGDLNSTQLSVLDDVSDLQFKIEREMKKYHDLLPETRKEFDKLAKDVAANLPAMKAAADVGEVSSKGKARPATEEQKAAAKAALAEAKKDAAEAVKIIEGYNKDVRAAQENLSKDLAGILALTGDSLGAAIEGVKAKFAEGKKKLGEMMATGVISQGTYASLFVGLSKAAEKEIDALVAASKKIPQAFAQSLPMIKPVFGQIAEAARNLAADLRDEIITVGEYWSALAPILYRGAVTAQEGVAAAGAKILGEVKETGQSVAGYLLGVWDAVGKGFEDSLYAVISGKADSLKDILKGVFDDILRSFSKMVTEMLQKWVASQTQMGKSAYVPGAGGATAGSNGAIGAAAGGGMFGSSEGWGSMGAGYANGGGIGGAAAGAGVGMGIGSLIGGLGNGKYNATGGQIGGAIGGAIFGVIGAVVGALIGTLIGALASPNTMQHVKGSLGAMVGSSDWIPDAWRQNPVYEKGPRGGEDGEPTYGEPTFVPGHWGPGEKAVTELEVAGRDILRKQTATFADLFRIGAKEQSRELLATYRQTLKESLSGANFDLNAGSSATIQDVTDYLTTKLIPRIGLSAAFGQVGYLPNGNQDRGGVGNLSYGMPGMNPDGTWQEKKLFSEDSPLFKMMVGIKAASGAYVDGLGFTVEKFAELAARISTDDPEKLLAYITGLVSVVAGLRDLGAEMGKTFGELAGAWEAEIAAGPAAAFGAAADDVKALFENLDLYAGDEQITKAQEALQASGDLWESVLSYLAKLKALADDMTNSIAAQRSAMASFLSPQTEGQKIAGAQSAIDSGWGAILNAKTPEAAARAAQDMREAIDLVFNIMAERITRGKALIEGLAGLSGKFGNISGNAEEAGLRESNPMAMVLRDVAKVSNEVARAATLSGVAQIEAIEAVGASAESLYANLESLLTSIASLSKQIGSSIDSQIWEMGVGELDAKGQAGAVTDRIKELKAQLELATSPAEIQAITSEIQSLMGRYVGTFTEDDPKRAEAIAWAKEQLENTKAIALAALEAMKKAAEEQAAILKGLLDTAGVLISTNVTEAAAAILQLSQTLGELDPFFRKAIEALGANVLLSLEPLRLAMEGASAIFTGATGSAAGSLTDPDGLGPSADSAATALGGFTAAVTAAAAALGTIGAGGGDAGKKTSPSAPPEAKQSVSAAAIVPIVRRHYGSLAPRVA